MQPPFQYANASFGFNKDGAIGFGERYGEGLMFDDPTNMRLYAACDKVRMPILFHMDDRLSKILSPPCNSNS